MQRFPGCNEQQGILRETAGLYDAAERGIRGMIDIADVEQELEIVRGEFHHQVEIAFTRIRDLIETRQDDADVAPLLGRVEDIADTAFEMLRWADRAAVLEKILEN